jgi:hypothetical protein
MKTKTILIFTILSFSITFHIYCQRDTIKYFPFILDVAIKDSNAYPIGITNDTFVITNRPELDSIFKIFKVKSMIKQWFAIDSSCNDGVFHLYQLYCNCNEYLFLDTLLKFNAYNNFNLLCYAFLLPRGSLGLNSINRIKDFRIYPNPSRDGFFIDFYIPGKIENSVLTFYDMIGKKILQIPITENTGKLRIGREQLKSPAYYHCILTVGGKDVIHRPVIVVE